MTLTADALRELHRLHKQLSDLRERIQRGPQQIRARQANLAKMAEELAKLDAEYKAARVRSDQKQLLLVSGEQKVENLKVKLNAAASNREYQALKDQIAADQMAGSVLSDEILETMEKIDELAEQVAEQQQKIAEANDVLAKAQQILRDQAGVLDADVKRVEAGLESAETALPDDIRKALWPFVEDVGRKSAERRSANQVLADLLESSASIVINLEALRKKRESGAD